MPIKKSESSLNLTFIERDKARLQIECDRDTAISIADLLKKNDATKKSNSRTRTWKEGLLIKLNSREKGKGWLRAKIIEDAEIFCRKYDISPTNLGKEAVGDPAFFGRFKKGERSIGHDKIERLYDFMDSYSVDSILK